MSVHGHAARERDPNTPRWSPLGIGGEAFFGRAGGGGGLSLRGTSPLHWGKLSLAQPKTLVASLD